MLTEFQSFLTFKNIYLLINLGVVPFWFLLLIIPNSKITQLFVNSIILPLIFASFYVYVIYLAILLDEPIFEIFRLYTSLDNLYTIFATENFLLAFWIHFTALNLFLGSWVSRDAIKYNVPKKLVFIILIIIYFTGPLGFTLYWIFRIFYAKKISLYD